MEIRSDHPIAQAIISFAESQGVRAALAEDFQIIPGKGATAPINGQQYWLVSHRCLEEREQGTDDVAHCVS